MKPLLERLRTETRSEHEQMESVFRLPESRDDHCAWAAAFLGFVAPVEKDLIRQLGAQNTLLAGRMKTAWLEQDLRDLGWDDEAIATVPQCEDRPRVDSTPRALGVMYVMEGSTLGGQFISRHLEKTLGLRDGRGYRYFQSYGSDVPRRWQEFRRELLEQSRPESEDAVLDAARETFQRLRMWCTQVT